MPAALLRCRGHNIVILMVRKIYFTQRREAAKKLSAWRLPQIILYHFRIGGVPSNYLHAPNINPIKVKDTTL